MFSKDSKREPEAPRQLKPVSRVSPPSIISASLRIVGNLVSDGDIQVDGTVDGDVNSRSLTISHGAAVNGAIVAETVRVDGAIKGQIKSANVVLGPTAHVTGDIVHTSLVVEAGAFVEGHVKRMEAEATPIVMPVSKPTVVEDKPTVVENKPLYGAAS